MNIKLYKKLVSFRSHSNTIVQIEFRNWLGEYILEHYSDVSVEYDEYGNLYVTKNPDEETTVNCVVAHLDINQKTYTDDFTIVKAGDYIVGMNNETGKQIGLGHDDKVGVYFALQALKRFRNIKCFFPLNEEIGLLGTKASDPEFFHDVGFFLQLDRRGFSDISEWTNGHDTVTNATKKEFAKILAKYNFHWTKTVSTDVGHLIQEHGIQGTNISCAYQNEHTEEETFNILRYGTCEKFAMEILKLTDGNIYGMFIEKKTTVSNTTTTNTTATTTSATTTTANKKEEVTATFPVTSTTEKKSSNVATKNNIPVTEIDDIDEVTTLIEELYDYDTSDDVVALKEHITDIHDQWMLLEESYEKHCLIYRLHEAVETLNSSLEPDAPLDLESELLSIVFDLECVAEYYSIDTRSREYEDYDLHTEDPYGGFAF
jgi:putative aminopeptidase FrvX